MEKIELLAIGDTTIDAFIRLQEASVHCDINKENCQLCMRFGDKIPYEFVEVVPAVGNSANAAVSAAKLGLSSALLANVGGDQNGKDCIEALQNQGVDTQFINIQKDQKTNYHYVLWYEDERTILVKHQPFSYALPPLPKVGWLYLSSLGENSLEYHQEILEYLKKDPNTKLVFQPGTFQMKFGYKALEGLYRRTHLFICNTDEARRILETKEEDIMKLLEELKEAGPEIVVITDGPKGAYAYDGNEAWFMPPYPDPKPPLQRTGAGDAFASTVTTALALGKPLEEALRWGPINSMSVVQQIGAQRGLLTREALETYLENAPADYKPKKLSI